MAIEATPNDAVARWSAVLDEQERARADRLRFASDRQTYIAAHAMTRMLLAAVGGLPAQQWRFVTSPTGKPAIASVAGEPPLRFNLSHTKGLVTCAVGFGHDVGIDVEVGDQIEDELGLAERFFAPGEVSLLRGVSADRRRETFLQIWTLKEAYIKTTGAGLTCPLAGFTFGFDPIHIRFGPDIADDPANWQFFQWRPTDRHQIALAARHVPAKLRVVRRRMNWEDL
ncbi:4'-phosphopantetheinyl transferase superfamily protein [Bradyrhizobium ontarionense]|uniref:4'-phosphopantetheinyl transferase superfamily protein n=1 Tax=Bradyrhizobium ontarionense TaxID=2898149 RepID=A0ABY3RAP2_9BRAD|nr:4'-phosphopantetheinyl transferase superfamily protein [Bradyrhizobium sp. A19]UFZ04107.1 4'-phosphopantetheinyl transferase superfamily protein [Bradyrhizobium sp. A19]